MKNPEKLIICAGATGLEDTGEYKRPSTGIGELRALAIIAPSLNTAHKNIKFKNIIMANEVLGERINDDIILLGGPKHNRFAKKLLECIKELSIVEQDEYALKWQVKNQEDQMFAWPDGNGKIHYDYGLIVRIENPFSSDNSTVYLFSGQHTYGVIAAAIYFVENYVKIRNILKRNVVAVVRCDVIDDYPVNIKLKHEKASWQKFHKENI